MCVTLWRLRLRPFLFTARRAKEKRLRRDAGRQNWSDAFSRESHEHPLIDKSGLIADDATPNSFGSPVLPGADSEYYEPAAGVTGHQGGTSLEASSSTQTFHSCTDSGADSEGDTSSQSGVCCYTDAAKCHRSFLTGMEQSEERGSYFLTILELDW
ncbi:hypothetical protein AAHC03_027149 [Spirometra sp. Aus1]